MPVNPYFGGNISYTPEQRLVEDLVIESIKIHGQDMYWCPRISVAEDPLYREDLLAKFDRAHTIEMYVKSIEGFEGEGDLLSRFGIEVRDQVTLVVSIRRFDELDTGFTRPREGDVIFHPLSKKLFAIQFVEHETLFYQTGALSVYELRCELFEYSNEIFSTGVEEIDKIQDDLQFTFDLILSSTSSGFGEFIKGIGIVPTGFPAAAGIIAKTVSLPISGGTVSVRPVRGEFKAGAAVITDDVKGIGAISSTFDELTQYQQSASEAGTIETSANTILDKTESTPFGDF